ncbi:hypothetical protein BDV18DRAFT_101382 [Aspergillus unguis]
MKLQSLALTLAACLSSVTAQGMADLPACAQDCATGAIPSECGLIDVECICATTAFIEDMSCCVAQSCEPKDQDTAIEFAHGICAGAGITDLPSAATCAGDSATTATNTDAETTTSDGDGTTTTTTTAEPSETPTSTTEGDETTTGTSNGTATETDTETSTGSSTESETQTSTDSSTQTETPSPTDSSTDAEGTGGAMLLRGKDVGVIAGIVAGVVFVM